LDIFGDFLYVLRLDKWGYIGYNPGNYGFIKGFMVWELGWFELAHYERLLKEVPSPTFLHFPPPNIYDYIISNILLWITCG
jgi:hypothetical protein